MEGGRDAVLVVEDDPAIAKVVVALLEQRGLEARSVVSAEDAMALLDKAAFDVVLTDVQLPGKDGLALLDYVRGRFAELPVVLITAHGSVALAVDAMKRGAADFVQKPFDRDELMFVIGKALEASRRERTTTPPPSAKVEGVVGRSDAMRDVFTTVRKVASTTATVLVRGETGTGKELIARAIHDASPRKSEAFVAVHCGALSETLLESELFGHEKGAFTGATHRKPGRVELAHKGTLFLDEIGDISPAVQVKLLRVLQERAFERVGGTETIRVDVRIVAATHRKLEAMITEGTFREDLFYRLAVVPIDIPPLRERPGDVAELVRLFTPAGTRLDEGALSLLVEQPWPGNVRQLQNFVERLVILADDAHVRRADVERELSRGNPITTTSATLDAARRLSERDALVRALAQAANNRTRAARLLEVSRRTLYNKLREHGID